MAAITAGSLATVASVQVRAGTPDPITVTAGQPGAAVTYSATLGPVEPDPTGPPAPACGGDSSGCDQESVTLAAGGFSAPTYALSLSVTVTYTAAAAGQCLDVTIENSAAAVLNSAACVTSGMSVTATKLAAGTYTVEVDADAATLPTASQPFTASVVGTASLAPTGGTPTPSPVTSPITFGVPSPVDPIHGVGEPDIAVDRAGHVFVSGPAGTGEQRSLWWGSSDAGSTYRVIESVGQATSLFGTANQPGGGDTDIAFDNQTPQTQYFADLAALVALRVVKTSNEGASETQTLFPGAGMSSSEVDRQWYAVWDPPSGTTSISPATSHPIIYVEYGPAPSKWYRSTDGQTFTSATPATHFGADGYPSIDQVTGDVFEANYNGSTISLNIGKPNDASGDLTFLDDSGQPGLITVAKGVDNSGDVANFVVTSMDSARNLYVTWVGRDNTTPTKRQVFVAAAPADNVTAVNGCTTNCWNNWTTPVQVSDGLSATGDAVNVFPWLKAGGPGMVDAVWYGDQSTLNPSATCTPVSAGCHVWNVFMNQVSFVTDSTGAVVHATPSTNLVKVTPHPMDYYDICLSGTGCVLSQGNRNLADFFEVTVDHTGAAEIVYDDMSNNLIQAGTSNALDHAGLPLPTVVRQNGGPGLLGTVVSGTSSAPTSSLGGPAGNALFPVIGGTNQPAMDLVKSSLDLSGSTLTVTMKVADLTQLASVATATGGSLEEFVTRWQMGNTIYYAEASMSGSTASAQFSAGKANSVDLCSVSACRPFVFVYGETPDAAAGQTSETGSVSCPASPSATSPCTITITVSAADVGMPAQNSLLEEVGAYALSTSHPQTGTTNAEAEADNVPLQIDGICCYNFTAAPAVTTPEAPWAPALLVTGAALMGLAAVRRRRALRPRRMP
ncbi:MAG: hypothetical protein ACYDAC_09885 [Candidatus Dormibacteria bacterium]